MLVTRTVDPNHGRILKSELTDEGTRVVGAAQVVIDEIQEELLEGVSQGDRRVVLEAMIKAMQRLHPDSQRSRS